MRAWVASAGVGFVRACVVVVITMLVPAVWASAVLLGVWVGGGIWIPALIWAGIGTIALGRPVARMFRAVVAKWTGTVIADGYRKPGPVTRMSTGFWWNGHSYERTKRDAEQDQRWRALVHDPAWRRDLRFAVIAPVTAGLVAVVPLAGVAGVVVAFLRASPVVGVLGVVVAVAVAPYGWRVAEPVAVRFLGASREQLAERVDELTAQRADTTIAQAVEIRRIERDLHDGAQARLVALGLSLVTAEKLMESDPEQAKALLREARVGAATSLTELRDLIKGIHPPVLNERGLVDAVRALALDSPLDVTVRADAEPRLEPPIESAVYFGIAELLTNVVKHAHASHASISLVHDGTEIEVVVEDDGRGGADARPGGGLDGLRRRLAVFDGTLVVTSPAGGPTRATMVVPCASL